MRNETVGRPTQIPVICLHRSGVGAFDVFNPNEWQGHSRGVVQSCSTEYSVVRYGLGRLTRLCRAPREHCRTHIATLQEQWNRAPWDLSRGVYFAQVPELHVLIEAFFGGMKGLLDLMTQLLTTEAVVGAKLDGFHRAGEVYGGRVLNALDRNVNAGKGPTARAVAALTRKHKTLWIDGVIRARDLLVHPSRGAHQVMFEMHLATRKNALVCQEVLPPRVGRTPIDRYAAKQTKNIEMFARAYLAELRACRLTPG